MTLRDIFWLDEAHERSSVVADRLGPSDFDMPWMNARADVIGADLLREDVGAVHRAWPAAWDDAVGVPGLGAMADHGAAGVGPGRCRAGGRPTRRGGDVVTPVARDGAVREPRKYEIGSLITLGAALSARGEHEAARGTAA